MDGTELNVCIDCVNTRKEISLPILVNVSDDRVEYVCLKCGKRGFPAITAHKARIYWNGANLFNLSPRVFKVAQELDLIYRMEPERYNGMLRLFYNFVEMWINDRKRIARAPKQEPERADNTATN